MNVYLIATLIRELLAILYVPVDCGRQGQSIEERNPVGRYVRKVRKVVFAPRSNYMKNEGGFIFNQKTVVSV